MATVKIPAFTRKVKGKSVKVAAHNRTIKTKSSSGKPKKPMTAAQKKHRHDYYQKNRTKILAKNKKH